MFTTLRDWLRGWSHADLVSLLDKLRAERPLGELYMITERERRAHIAHARKHGLRAKHRLAKTVEGK